MSTLGTENLISIKYGNPEDGGKEITTACLGNTIVFENEDYINFTDANEEKRLCSINWGTYKQTVTTDNGDDTVTITSKKIKKKNTSILYRAIISDVTREKEEGDTAGTVNTSIGMTYKQAAAVTNIGTVFKNNKSITSLKELRYFTGLTTLPNQAFEGCSVLLHIEIPVNITKMMFNQIRSNPKLQWVKLLPNRVIPMQGNNCLYGTNNCPVYVPDNLVDSYKTAANWSQYASRFRAMSTAPE